MAIVTNIYLLVVSLLIVFSSVLQSYVYIIVLVIPFVVIRCFNKVLKIFLIDLSFLFFFILSVPIGVVSGTFDNILTIFTSLAAILFIRSMRNREMVAVAKSIIVFLTVFIIMAVMSSEVELAWFLNIISGGRVLYWNILGVELNANTVGMNSALLFLFTVAIKNYCLPNESYFSHKILYSLSLMIALCVLVLSGSRTAFIMCIAFYILKMCKFNFFSALVTVSFFCLLIITYQHAEIDLRLINLSNGDSGRLSLWEQTWLLWVSGGGANISSQQLYENNIILDGLYVTLLFKYGVFSLLPYVIVFSFLLFGFFKTKDERVYCFFAFSMSLLLAGLAESNLLGISVSFFLFYLSLCFIQLSSRYDKCHD